MTRDSKDEGEEMLRHGLMQDIGRYVLGPIALRMFPALLLTFLYGAVNFIVIGTELRHDAETYIPVIGSLLSVVGIFAYGMAIS